MKLFIPESYDEDEDFKERRDAYLSRLHECRRGLVEKLTNGDERAPYLDIVLDPQDEAELCLAIIFLGFLDDNKQISENVKEGKIKSIDVDSSVGVLYASRIIGALNEGRELGYEEGEFYAHFALFARVLYDLTVLSQTDDLAQIIARRNGWNMEKRKETDRIKSLSDINELCDTLINTMLDSSYFKSLDRASDDFENSAYRFVDMAEAFHDEYLKGLVFSAGADETSKQEDSVQFVKKPVVSITNVDSQDGNN